MSNQMDALGFRFPRQLEVDGTDGKIRRVLMERTTKLWSRGAIEIPILQVSPALEKAVRNAALRNYIRCGFEGISVRLEHERRGIAKVRPVGDEGSDRISRLILISNDGAERLYRHIEELLILYAPRLLACMLPIDSAGFGKLVTGRESRIKIAMAEHKQAVSDILRAVSASE